MQPEDKIALVRARERPRARDDGRRRRQRRARRSPPPMSASPWARAAPRPRRRPPTSSSWSTGSTGWSAPSPSARRSHDIALQSVYAGIGLSLAAMVVAALGYLTAGRGRTAQEVIDVIAILNALRALGCPLSARPPDDPAAEGRTFQAGGRASGAVGRSRAISHRRGTGPASVRPGSRQGNSRNWSACSTTGCFPTRTRDDREVYAPIRKGGHDDDALAGMSRTHMEIHRMARNLQAMRQDIDEAPPTDARALRAAAPAARPRGHHPPAFRAGGGNLPFARPGIDRRSGGARRRRPHDPAASGLLQETLERIERPFADMVFDALGILPGCVRDRRPRRQRNASTISWRRRDAAASSLPSSVRKTPR